MLIKVSLSLRRRQPLALLALLAVLSPGISFAQSADTAGTLPEDYYPGLKSILDVALKQSPQMLARNIDLAQSEANRYMADANLWPTLSGYSAYSTLWQQATNNGEKGDVSRSNGLNYSVAVSQPIFQWGVYKYQSDIGKLAQQIVNRQYADAWRMLAMSVRAQYLTLIAKKVSLRNSRNQVAIMRNDLAGQEQQLKEGTISEGEIITPRLGLKEYELSLDRALQDYENSKLLFIRMSGVSQLPDDAIPTEMVRPEVSRARRDALLAAFRRDGAENTLQGQVYVMQIKQRDLDYRIASKTLYPKFFLDANYGVTNDSSGSGLTVTQRFLTSYGGSVRASWTLFDGFRTRGSKLSALATKRATERQFQNYTEATMDQAESMVKQLEFLGRSMELAEERRSLAEDAVKKVTDQLQEGTLSKSVLDGTRGNFYLADYVAIGARADYLNRWADFVSLVSLDPALAGLPTRYLNFKHGK